MLSKKFRQACPESICIPVSRVRMDHILVGEVKNGGVNGFHHWPSGELVGGRKIIHRGPKNVKGVYDAKVAIYNPSSPIGQRWKVRFNTMFPDEWSPSKVESEIRAAYLDAFSREKITPNELWTGKSPSGIWIRGRIDSDGLIHQAYPVF